MKKLPSTVNILTNYKSNILTLGPFKRILKIRARYGRPDIRPESRPLFRSHIEKMMRPERRIIGPGFVYLWENTAEKIVTGFLVKNTNYP